MAEQTYFEVLGVSESATADEIKRAWARKVKEYPPGTAASMNQRVNEAKRTLLDDKARANYVQQMRHGPAIDDAVRRAQDADARGDHRAEAAAYREALALAPDNQSLRSAYALSLYEAGDEAKGITVMEGLVQRAPEIALYRYYVGGMILNEEGKDDDATRRRAHLHFQAAVRMEPDHVDYLVGLARCLRAMKQFREAESTIERALMSDGKIDVQDVDTMFELPIIHLYAQELHRVRTDAERIMAVVRDLDQEAREYCAGRFSRTAADLWEAHAYEEAAVFLEAATRFDPGNADLRGALVEANRCAAIARELDSLANDTTVARPFAALLIARALAELGQIDDTEFRSQTDTAFSHLGTLDHGTSRSSLMTCKVLYPTIWALEAEIYEKWLRDLKSPSRGSGPAAPPQATGCVMLLLVTAALLGALFGPVRALSPVRGRAPKPSFHRSIRQGVQAPGTTKQDGPTHG